MLLYMLSSVCIDDQFLMKSYKTSQGLEIQSSIDSPRHHLSSINRCESAIQDVGGGIEEEENSFFSETQENKLKFYNLKYVNNFKNNFYFEKLIKFTPTFSNYTYTPNKPFNENQGNGNLIFSSIYTTPYQYFSKNTENIDNTHYSPCTDDNISIVRENYSNTDTNFRSNDIKEDHKHCHNPQLCSQIFETLLHSKSLRNQEFLKRSHFENNSNITICKDNYDDGNSAKYPYRTVSHFGFNTPIRYPQPHHKHLAVNLKKCQKYVPLGRSISYEEIFSSPRYLDLCEFCFELIVHLKPELTKCDTKLNNLTEYSDVCFKLVSNDNKNQSETHNYITNLKKHHSEFCHPLHSVEEMKETATDTCYKEDSYDISSSTFHDKIPCKNYSEVYSNTDYMQSRYLLSTPISFPELVYNSENRTQYGSNNNISDQMTELCDDFNNFDVLKNNNNEFFENTVKIKEFESISNMFMNRDELKCRKFMKENISSNENINNSQYAKKYSNVKTNVSNISCALKDVNSEKDSTFTNKSNVHQLTVEEFNRTLSRITISSTQRNSLADVHDNPSRFPIVNIENDENKNSSYKNSSFDGIQELPAQNRKINAVNFNKNVEDENIDKYSPLERTILRKIRTNKLSKRDDIFGKIENTIRNKRTPSKLELIIKEQLLVLPDKDMNKQIKNPKFKSIRKSYSASPPKNYFSTPKSKLNKVSSISSDSIRNIASVSKIKSNSNIIRSCPQKTINKASKSRNFILENIRNVSNIRHFPQIKHFPSNIDNKSGKCCSRLLSFEDSVCTNKQLKSMSPRNTASSEIYPFQSKLVKGSARFWVSMSEKGLAEKSKTFLAKKRKLLTTSLNTTPINTNVSTVDNEINALGAEIQQIHPRLENYKRKLDEFGNRVADCVNNINECVATQENIIDLQKKLRNSIQSHQYSEKIMCRVQTFSLSETED